MVSIIRMVFSSVLGDPVLINATQTNEGESSSLDFLCLFGMFYIVIVLVALAWSNIEKKRYSIQVYSDEIMSKEMPGKKVLFLRWEDSQNSFPGKKHYLVRKGYGKMPSRYEDVGSTDQFFLIDNTYKPGYTQFYVVMCIEDKRVSHFEIRNYQA